MNTKKAIIWIVVAVIVVFGAVNLTIILTGTPVNNEEENDANVEQDFALDPDQEAAETLAEEQGNLPPSINPSPSGSSSSGGGGGGGGSGGASGTTSSGSEECYEVQVSYSAEEFAYETECQQSQGSICENQLVNCTVEINNFDPDISDVFEVEFIFFQASNTSDDPIGAESLSSVISSNDKKIFESLKTFTSTGSQGIANQELECTFRTLQVPRKQVCN